MTSLPPAPVLVGLGVAFLAVLLYVISKRATANEVSSLGRVVWHDGSGTASLWDRPNDLSGKPDAIVLAGPFWRKEPRPVEYKAKPFTPPGKAVEPLPSHVAQLMAQGLLLEAKYGAYPRMGYLVYRGCDPMPIKLGAKAKAEILGIMETMRASAPYPVKLPVDARCRGCPVADRCRLQGNARVA